MPPFWDTRSRTFGVPLALPITAFGHHAYLAGVRTAVVLREQIVFAIKLQKAKEVADCIHMQLVNHIGRLHVTHHQLFTGTSPLTHRPWSLFSV